MNKSKFLEKIPLGPCQDCGGIAHDKICSDYDAFFSIKENVYFLCRRCHMIRDGRMEKLKEVGKNNSEKAKKEESRCNNCGTNYKPLRKGRCDSCYTFYRKYRSEKPVENKEFDPRLFCDCGKQKNIRSKHCYFCSKKRSVDEAGEKLCRQCNRVLPLDRFGIRRGDRPRSKCRECESESSKQHGKKMRREYPAIVKRKRKEWIRKNSLRHSLTVKRNTMRRWGFSEEKIKEVINLWEKTDCCEICGIHKDICGTLHIDHNHDSGNFRGFLCGKCNTGLGQLRDNIEILRKAISYLETRP